MCLFEIILFGTLWAFWIWMSLSFPRQGHFQPLFLQLIWGTFFSFSFPSESTKMWMLLHLMLSQQSHNVSFLFKVLFSFCRSVWVSSIVLSSSSLIHSTTSSVLLLSLSNVFFWFSYYFCLVLSCRLCWSLHYVHLFFSKVQ